MQMKQFKSGRLNLTRPVLQEWIDTLFPFRKKDEDIDGCLYMCILLERDDEFDDALWRDCKLIPIRTNTDTWFAHDVQCHIESMTSLATNTSTLSPVLHMLRKTMPQKHQPPHLCKRFAADGLYLMSDTVRPPIVSALVFFLLNRNLTLDELRVILRNYSIRYTDRVDVRAWVSNFFKDQNYLIGLLAIKTYVITVMRIIGLAPDHLSPRWMDYSNRLDECCQIWFKTGNIEPMKAFKSCLADIAPGLRIQVDFWRWIQSVVPYGTSLHASIEYERCNDVNIQRVSFKFLLLFKRRLGITDEEFIKLYQLMYMFYFQPTGNDRQAAIVKSQPDNILGMLANVSATWMHYRTFTYHVWPNNFDVMDRVKLRMLKLEIPATEQFVRVVTSFVTCPNCKGPRTILNSIPLLNGPPVLVRDSSATLGVKEVAFDTETGDIFCSRTGSRLSTNCSVLPCVYVSLTNCFVYFNKTVYCLCTACAMPMQWSREFLLFTKTGPVCSRCSVLLSSSRSRRAQST